MTMAETQIVLFDYIALPDGSQQVLYLGKATVGSSQSDPCWQIQKFTYSVETDSKYYVTQIETLNGKAWSDRATYNW